jgi:hypothetical protein
MWLHRLRSRGIEPTESGEVVLFKSLVAVGPAVNRQGPRSRVEWD